MVPCKGMGLQWEGEGTTGTPQGDQSIPCSPGLLSTRRLMAKREKKESKAPQLVISLTLSGRG